MKIVFVSHSYFGPYFVVGSHHLARQFARRGHSVWHIGPCPVFQLFKPSPDYAIKVRRLFQGVIDIEPNLKEAVVRPLFPWQATRRLLSHGNFFLKCSDIGILVQSYPELRDVDVLIVDEPRLTGIEDYIRAKAVYYRPTDLYAAMKNDKDIELIEAKLLNQCRGLIATSEPVMNRMLSLSKSIPHLILTNGVDEAIASPKEEPAVLRPIPRPRVVYVGAIDERLDLAAIKFLADRFPAVSFVVLGTGVRFGELQAMTRANLHALGPIPHSQLGSYLQYCDVGLLPMVKSLSNEGRSPMKLYEYGLCGLSVLAGRTSELDRRTEDFIHLYSDYEEAARRLEAILSSKRDRAAITAQCAPQTWPKKAETLERFIAETS